MKHYPLWGAGHSTFQLLRFEAFIKPDTCVLVYHYGRVRPGVADGTNGL
jgi:hypothetical protein